MTRRDAFAMQALDDHGIEAFVDDIIDGKSYAQIGMDLGVAKSAVNRWLAADPNRSARAREALIQSAQGEDDKAEMVLLGHVKDADNQPLDPVIRRELASHYRWRARVRNPREYGEKIDINQRTTVVNLSNEELQRELERIRQARAAALPDAATLVPVRDPWADDPAPQAEE
jgi:hypothetical protein